MNFTLVETRKQWNLSSKFGEKLKNEIYQFGNDSLRKNRGNES